MPQQPDTGTSSYYGVGAYLRPVEDARLSAPAFATECLAFSNIPEPSALARMPGGRATRAHHAQWKARSPRDLGAGWDFDDVRDHYMERLFGTDARALRAVDHERYLALGRMATAETMGMAFAQWRRPDSSCRGALVLCLRDLWAGAGWGVIDDAGVPKACYHALKRALQPVAVLLTDEGMNGLFVHVINETAEPVALTLALSAWKDGHVQVAAAERSLTVPPREGVTWPCLALMNHFVDLNWAYRFGPPACDAVCAELRGASGQLVGRAFHFVEGLCARPAADVGLQVQATLVGSDAGELRIRTRGLAQGIHLQVPGFEPEDDHFHLPPRAEARVRLRRTGTQPLAGWVHALNSTQGAAFECASAAESVTAP